ncbi:Rz1-like lysis system protein LysC [Photobacterium damselae]|uniref:Rz1-like lysis system protein LysC n=1 Tax=Photobacterium damselae TaxID=38293 RepID=UPI001246D2FD|nr:hypothetical protein F6477_04155 [Photobacterium damselae subsp. damselae]
MNENGYLKILRCLRKSYRITNLSILLILSLFLSGCVSPIKVITKTDTIYVLPPVGLVIPCHKPTVTAKTPAQLPADVLRLKSALKECAQYVDDYLNWRKVKETSN